MKIGYGKSRIIWYVIIGVLLGSFLVGLHNILERTLPSYHNWILAILIPIVATGMALLAIRENSVYEWGSRLDAARQRINELMQTAVAQKHWTFSFEDPSLPTCWQELGCDKEDCPAYGLKHSRCWLIAGTFCRGEVQGQFAKKLKDCRLCQVYQQATSDPVKEITENFFAMNYLLREREERLEDAYQEARDRSEKLTGLVALSEAALSSVHLSEVLQNLLDSAAALAGADMGFVSLVDAGGEDLVARVTFGVAAGASRKLTTKVGKGIIGRAFAGTYIAVSEDLTLDSRFVCPYLKSLNVKSLISLPFIGSKKPLGMLTLCTFTPHHFTKEEKDLLCVAANRMAAAVENMRLETELSRGRGQIELMEAVTKDASAQKGMSGVYKTFINHATKIIDFDRAALTIWHPGSQELEILAVDTKAPKTWLGSGLKLPKDATPVAKVVETSRPLLRDEIAGDEYPADKLLIEEGIRSEVFIPLMSKGEVLGIVNLGSFKPHAFAREDLELLEPVARQLGLVLDNARLLEETKRLSLVDSLTGLYNHRYFYEAVAREVTRSARYGRPVSVMMIGIDGFKDFNNNYGHLEGDRVLKEIGETLRRVVRKIDVTARYGSDEFAVLLPELSVEEEGTEKPNAVRIARRIREAITDNVFLADAEHPLPITLSIGIAAYPAHAGDVTSFLERADWALRKAKEEGRNRAVVAQKVS